MRRVSRAAGLVLGALALLHCSTDSDGAARLDNYLTRLGRGLDLAPIELGRNDPLIAPPRLVDADIRRLDIDRSSIGVLDFLSLSGCALQVNLGRRNSSLGRNASPSQRLILDLEFLQLAPACIAHLKETDKQALAQTLSDISRDRRQQLPRRIYNALLAGPEFQQFWHLPARLEDYPQQTGGDVLDALAYFNNSIEQWLAGNYTVDSLAMEGQLARLRSGDGGALLKAVALQAQALSRATRMVNTRAQERPLCPGGRKTRSATITETVVTQFFVADVQGWLARISQRENQLMPLIEAIEGQLSDVLPRNYRDWQAKRMSLLARLRSAPKAHILAIQKSLSGCPDVPWNQAH